MAIKLTAQKSLQSRKRQRNSMKQKKKLEGSVVMRHYGEEAERARSLEAAVVI